MALDVKISKSSDYPILELIGRVVDSDVRKFSKKLETLYKKSHKKIVIDITHASFMDSHGLGILVYYHSTMEKEGRTLLLLNDDPSTTTYITRLFEVTNLSKILKIITSDNLI